MHYLFVLEDPSFLLQQKIPECPLQFKKKKQSRDGGEKRKWDFSALEKKMKLLEKRQEKGPASDESINQSPTHYGLFARTGQDQSGGREGFAC